MLAIVGLVKPLLGNALRAVEAHQGTRAGGAGLVQCRCCRRSGSPCLGLAVHQLGQQLHSVAAHAAARTCVRGAAGRRRSCCNCAVNSVEQAQQALGPDSAERIYWEALLLRNKKTHNANLAGVRTRISAC